MLGQYAQLDKFLPRVQQLCQKGFLDDKSQQVGFYDMNLALLDCLGSKGMMDKAMGLSDSMRNNELARMLAKMWPEWLSERVNENHGLVLCGFELFFAYLDSNALALVRQYAINGKHICLILPATEQDRQVWAFHEAPEDRRQITGLVSEWTYILKDGA